MNDRKSLKIQHVNNTSFNEKLSLGLVSFCFFFSFSLCVIAVEKPILEREREHLTIHVCKFKYNIITYVLLTSNGK